MNGVLIVDKPLGPTSHDVVARVRRAIGISRIGHTGTLDPLATGVLPLVVGRATRLAQFLTADEKEYVAGIRLGVATATYDAEERLVPNETGEPVLFLPVRHRPAFTEAELREALTDFTGTYWQVPPPFSAKKVGGRPAYELARRQKAVELKAVEVTVRELELVRYDDGLALVRVVCSSGFYVRSLANDFGRRLGCGAHLESLRRTRAGEFHGHQAVPLSLIQEEGTAALSRLVPVEGLVVPGCRTWWSTSGGPGAPPTAMRSLPRTSGMRIGRFPSMSRQGPCGCWTPTGRCWPSAGLPAGAFCNRSSSWFKILSPLNLKQGDRENALYYGGLVRRRVAPPAAGSDERAVPLLGRAWRLTRGIQ